MATQQEVIKTFMQSLDKTTLTGTAAFNEAIKASSNFKSFKALRTKFLADLKAAKNWHTFLVEKCGIILDNQDTGAISGADAGGSEVKTSDNILPSTGEAKYPSGSEFTVNGMTLYGIPPKDMLTEDEQYVVKGLCSWWLRDALALIKESYGLTFTEKGTTSSRLKLKFVDEPDAGYVAYVDFKDDGNRNVYEARVLCVNMAYFKNMNSDDRHGVTEDGEHLDRTLTHELVHGLMASNYFAIEDLPPFFIEGGSAELIHGIDDERYKDIIEYAKDPKVFQKYITADGFPDDPDYEEPYEIYAAGYVFMRYFAKQAATTTFDYDTYHKTVGVNSLNFATNYHDKVTMRGSANADTITNSGYNVTISAGKGNDFIKNYSDTVSVNGGNGKDTVFNEGTNVTLTGGKGNDSIDNKGSNVTIYGGNGKDSINNSGASVFISGGDGKDFILNYGSSISVDGGAGNDNIENYDSKVSIGAGAGNDSVKNVSEKVTISGGADNDSISNLGTTSKIYGGAGDDIILNDVITDMITISGSKSTIYGGAGKDSVSNKASRVKIYGQDDADSISNSGKRTGIYGGSAADYISNSGASVSIAGDDGNDFITNSGTLSYISLGAGNDTLQNFADSISADGGSGKNRIINRGDNFTLVGGTGRDIIYNYGDDSSLTSGNGNDYIFNGGMNVSISSGAGDDSIRNEGVASSILGGAGNDILRNDGDHVTLSGGKGDDYLRNSGGKHITYRFGKNQGNDTVVGFNAFDTVQIVSGKYSASASGKNVVVKVGSSALTLRNAVGKEINFVSASGETSSKIFALLVDDNFFANNDLSAIVKDKNISTYSAGELDTSNLASLTKKNNLVTYGGKK